MCETTKEVTEVTTTTRMTLTELAAAVDAAMVAVWDADSAWAADLDSADAKAAYKAARATYRALAGEAEDRGMMEECSRCGGKGGWEGWPGWTCYRCFGTTKTPFRPARFEAMPSTRAKKAAAAAAKRAVEKAEEDAKYAAFAAADPEVAAFFATLPEMPTDADSDHTWEEWHRDHAFFAGLREKARRFGSLTEKQRACVTREIEKRADRAAAVEFPRGEATVEGEIVSLPRSRGYGGGTKTNMLVKLGGDYRGNKVMGTIPAKVWSAMDSDDGESHGNLVGSRVCFTAVFTRSDDDEHFGFYRSPKKVEVLHANRD